MNPQDLDSNYQMNPQDDDRRAMLAFITVLIMVAIGFVLLLCLPLVVGADENNTGGRYTQLSAEAGLKRTSVQVMQVGNDATPTKNEAYYTAKLAPKYEAETEVVMPDGTRCDLLTKTHAIEVDWAKQGKNFEAIGQSLYYSILTGKKPGIILLLKDRGDMRFAYRTLVVAAKYDIRVWIEDVSD